MPRPLRIEFEGALNHGMSHGDRRDPIGAAAEVSFADECVHLNPSELGGGEGSECTHSYGAAIRRASTGNAIQARVNLPEFCRAIFGEER
jgi:hypothetical protein